MGNQYRLVVRKVFEFKAVQIKWFETHSEYDRIEVKTAQYKKRYIINALNSRYWLYDDLGICIELKIIKTKKEYNQFLDWVYEMFDKKTKLNSPEGKTLQIVLLLITQYEEQHFTISKPYPIESIKLKMLEKGIKNKDLVGKVGSKGYVKALLNKRKPLTLELAKLFHNDLGVPADVLYNPIKASLTPKETGVITSKK